MEIRLCISYSFPRATSALLHITYPTVRKNNYLIVIGTLLSVLCVYMKTWDLYVTLWTQVDLAGVRFVIFQGGPC